MIAPAREAAYDALRAVSTESADLPHALARARSRLPDERDRALTGEIVTGTLRWQGAFDHVIAEFSRRPVTRLDPEVLDILRSAIFQLLHLDRVPAAAVVSDAVNMTRKAGKKSAGPLVNALLRRVSRERHHLPLPGRPATPDDRAAALDYLAITLSHPRWLAARWLDRYGFDGDRSMAAVQQPPRTADDSHEQAEDFRQLARRIPGGARDPGRAGSIRSRRVDSTKGKPSPDTAGRHRTLRRAGRSVTAHRGARLRAERRARARRLRVAGWQDHGNCRGHGRRGPDRCHRRPRETGGPAREDRQAVGCPVREDRSSRCSRAASDGVLRLGASRCSLLRARHDPSRSGRPLAPIRGRPREARSRRSGRCSGKRLACSVPVAGSSTRRAPASPRKTRRSSPRFVAESGFRPLTPRDLPAPIQSLINPAGHLRTFPFRDGLEAFFGAILTKVD